VTRRETRLAVIDVVGFENEPDDVAARDARELEV
jgi:hypothetical protein